MINGQAPLNNQSQITNGGGLLIWELQNGPRALGLQTSYVCEEPKNDAQKSVEIHKPASLDSQSKMAMKGGSEAIDSAVVAIGKPVFSSAADDTAANSQFSIKNIPFNARWFDLSTIHTIEKQHLPEFFEEKPSKTPAIYQRLRNFIVHLYWLNPKLYLTATACRRYVRGDACAVLRVHAFLEHWNIINCNYKPSSIGLANQMKEQFSFPTFSREDSKIEQRKIPSLIESAKESPPSKKPPIGPQLLPPVLNKEPTEDNGCSEEFPTADFPQPLRIDWFGNTGFKALIIDKIFELTGYSKPKCSRCLRWVSDTWFVKSLELHLGSKNQKGNVLTICEPCYDTENFPIFFSKNDFQKVTLSDLYRSRLADKKAPKEWSLQDQTEVVNLLAKSKGLESSLASLKHRFPERAETEFLLLILRISKEMDLVEISSSIPLRENQLTYQKTFTKSFENRLEQIDKILEENQHSDLSENIEKHLPQYDQKKSDELLKSFEERVEKINKKLFFFAEFEKILYHEKLNLQMIR